MSTTVPSATKSSRARSPTSITSSLRTSARKPGLAITEGVSGHTASAYLSPCIKTVAIASCHSSMAASSLLSGAVKSVNAIMYWSTPAVILMPRPNGCMPKWQLNLGAFSPNRSSSDKEASCSACVYFPSGILKNTNGLRKPACDPVGIVLVTASSAIFEPV